MYTIVLQVFNHFGEIEHEKSFHSATLRGASIACGKYIKSEWGKTETENWNINKRQSTVSSTMYFWEVR